MRSLARRALLLLIIPAALVWLMPAVVSADVNNFNVDDFTADYYLTNDSPQGQMRIVEKISVNFSDYNHGILRAIPMYYKGLPLNIRINRISSETGAPTQYTTSTQNSNEVLKIGDPSRTVTGKQEYTIDYTVQHVITFYQDHDELYWDINGDQWEQLFTAVKGTIHLPTSVSLSQTPVCYAGFYGQRNHNCTVDASAHEVTVSAGELSGSESLTVVIGMQKGYFHPAGVVDYVSAYAKYLVEFFIPFLLIGGAGFVWWFKRGRDAKGTGVIIPEYDAPDKLTPLEVGAIVDFSVDNKDLTATMVDLAIRKYIRIIETDKKILMVGSKQFSLQLIKTDWSGLNEWERTLMSGLFGADGSKTTVELSKPVIGFSQIARAIKRSVESSLASRGYFAGNPYMYVGVPTGTLIIVGWILAPTFGIHIFTLGNLVGAGIAAGTITFAIFYRFMPARTALGVAAKEHILGLKLYLEVAEKDRIKMLQSPNAPYAPRSDVPEQTVDLFEKLLPFAIVLGVEQLWAQKFENIYSSPPDWYVGNYTAFNAGYLAGSLGTGFGSAIGTTFGTARSSSGSGFGGGGFSGGGGGGGGGGGW